MHMPYFFISRFVSFIVIYIPVVLICYMLAKEKGKDITLWTVLSLIPVINFFVLLYLVGTPNTALDKKVDRILNLLPKEEESKVIQKKAKPVKNVKEEKEEEKA